MNFFRSKLAKMEDLLAKKPEDRKAEDLAAAQAELDTNNAGVILVPKTDTIKTAADLQQHIDGLTSAASTAKASADEAKKTADKAKADLETLKGTRVLDSPQVTSDKKEGGDKQGQQTEAEKREAVVSDSSAPWNAAADALGLPFAAVQEEEPKTKTEDK